MKPPVIITEDELIAACKRSEKPCTDIQIAFSQADLQQRAFAYLTQLYGKPGQGNDADKWMERFGLISGFIDEQFHQIHIATPP